MTAPLCGLFFRHVIHVCVGKTFDCIVYIVAVIVLYTGILILFLVNTIDLLEIFYEHSLLFLLILSSDVELNPGPVYAGNEKYRVL